MCFARRVLLGGVDWDNKSCIARANAIPSEGRNEEAPYDPEQGFEIEED
jgi:hypothetical protein